MAEKQKLYEVLKAERKQLIEHEISDKLARKTKRLKQNQSVKTAVLNCMVTRDYESASEILTNYLDQHGHFVEFQMRVDPYIIHCKNLVRSIEIKRNFPKITSLPIIKQQELMDKVVQDFNELRLYLSRIEVMKTEVVFKEVLSMRLIIKTIMFSTMFLVVMAAIFNVGVGNVDLINAFIEEGAEAVAKFFAG